MLSGFVFRCLMSIFLITYARVVHKCHRSSVKMVITGVICCWLQMLSCLEHMYHDLGLVKDFSINPITLKRWLVRRSDILHLHFCDIPSAQTCLSVSEAVYP